ncbi:hypothetical protein JHL18_15015 [Clostridium sp. YIM B02505]|uniref:Uncharacterized protein n=1 Tax=Clostridium yunnanense TaxID=2800325 RepID=A0ABS1ERG3_9CLOT|nr:hypothetical protein [Clostridium yunnanense]MBK1811930.1 hypothetical protein [Clostridium yunnanense]
MELDKNYIIHQLENQVAGLLRQKYLPEERPIESMFQIIYEPPFEEKVSLEIFKNINQENTECYFVIRSVWDKAEDCSKLDVPLVALKAKYNKGQIIPTIKREKTYIDKSIVDEMFFQLSNIKVSPIPNKISTGFDGTTCELRVNSICNSCHFRWWEEGPENWSELTGYVEKILEYFNEGEI